MKTLLKLIGVIAFFLFSLPSVYAGTVSAERYANLYALPYYNAEGGKVSQARVYNQIDGLLLKNDYESFKQAVKIVEEDTAAITPMTMFALAARYYDFNERDKAVFWYLNGKYRLRLIDDVLALPRMNMAEYIGFMKVVGHYVDAYRYCDFAKNEEISAQSYKWTKANPYEILLYDQFPSKHQDRKAAILEAMNDIGKSIKEERDYYIQNKADIEKKRKDNGMNEMFCW